jgi:N-acyl-D-amino-acid deacylase
MTHDLVIRAGTVVDGSGAPATTADVAVDGDRVTVVGRVDGTGRREVDADGLLVTPGFVDIHTHLDAQLAWDPVGSPSCWHGVTSVVMGNCGVTFAPVAPGGAEFLAEMMESVEDIPARAILEGLPWTWTGYGGYLDALDGMDLGINAGGMVGHCAVRMAVMGDRALDKDPAGADEVAEMAALVDDAMAAGALGFSTSRTYLHRVPDGRHVPGTYAADDEMYAFGDVLGRHGRGVFESAPRFEADDDELSATRHEIHVLAEISRRSGRPVTFGLAQSNRKPDLWQQILDILAGELAQGGTVRPQTTCRSIGVVLGITHRTPWDRAPAWRELCALEPQARLAATADPEWRTRLLAEAESQAVDAESVVLLWPENPNYRHGPDDTLGAEARRRGVSPAEAFLDFSRETQGLGMLNLPILNQDFAAVEAMLSDDNVLLGLADAGAHVGQIMDASQPSWTLGHWTRDRGFFTIEDAVRRMTSDTAGLFGLSGRGVLAPGAFADVNVIDLDGVGLGAPGWVNDFPGGAGRLIQRGRGYRHTFVNGQEFMVDGEHTGVLAGRVLRSTDAPV